MVEQNPSDDKFWDSSTPCDVDDVLCQIETLRHLRGLQKEMGKEPFTSRFPELVGLEDRITDEIVKQEDTLAEAIERCQTQEEVEIEEAPEEDYGSSR